VDSSYVALLAARHSLRTLLVHFDNGWNSAVAVENIRGIVDGLGFDLETYVIDWEEFRDLQRSFFQASVVDIEMLTDHAITAAMFSIARKRGIRYILSGVNLATESGLPQAWYWNKQDLRNIKAIHKRFGGVKLNSFPTLSTWRWIVQRHLRRFVFVEILNMVNYRKLEAMAQLTSELGWRYYGGKHYESVFTKFYQAYVLPTKFGIDKRKAHLSSLVRNGELRRDEALAELAKPLYDPAELRQEKEYVLKKLDFSEQEFERIMALPVRSHLDYPSDRWLIDLARRVEALCPGALRAKR
jgi:hypothetical protein